MVLKYDFNMTNTNNFFVDSLFYVNTHGEGLVIYTLVLIFFGVASWVFIKRTQDIELSLVRSGFLSVLLSCLFYYLGVRFGVSLFSGSILVALILIVSIGGGLLYYDRNNLGG